MAGLLDVYLAAKISSSCNVFLQKLSRRTCDVVDGGEGGGEVSGSTEVSFCRSFPHLSTVSFHRSELFIQTLHFYCTGRMFFNWIKSEKAKENQSQQILEKLLGSIAKTY